MSNIISKRLKVSIQRFEQTLKLNRTVLSRADEIDKWTHCYWKCFKRKAVKASSVFLFELRNHKHRDYSFAMSFDFYDESEPRKYNQKSYPILPIEEQTIKFSVSFNNKDGEDKQIEYSKAYHLDEAKELFKRINKLIDEKIKKKGKELTDEEIIKFIDEEFFGNNELSIKKDEAFLEKIMADDIKKMEDVIKARDKARKEKNRSQKELKKRLKESEAQKKVRELEEKLELARKELREFEVSVEKELDVHGAKIRSSNANDLFEKESRIITQKAIDVANENDISIRNIKIIKELINS